MNNIKNELSQRFLEFQLGTEFYVIELLNVREVITPPELTPIPKAPSYVCGLMNLRGVVLTIIDLRKKLAITPMSNQQESAVIIIDLDGRLIGAWVDNICRVIDIKNEFIKNVPDTKNSNLTQYLKGVLQFSDKLALWLDVEKLLNSETIKNIKTA